MLEARDAYNTGEKNENGEMRKNEGKKEERKKTALVNQRTIQYSLSSFVAAAVLFIFRAYLVVF